MDTSMRRSGCLFLLFLIFGGLLVKAVDRSKFRTCASTGFCTAYRSSPGPALFDGGESATPLTPDAGNIVVRNKYISLECLSSGAVRVRVEKGAKRWQSDQVLQDTTRIPFTIHGDLFECASATLIKFDTASAKLSFFRTNEASKPFLVLNERGMTYVENPASATPELPKVGEKENGEQARRTEERKIVDWGEDGKPIYEDEEGNKHHGEEEEKEKTEEENPVATSAGNPAANSRTAPESFGGFTDNKPKGPMSVGFDATFYDTSANIQVTLHGLPEHATAFSLKDTDGSSGAYSEPFRLYNLDVFEYELDEPMALYGGVPYILARDSSDKYAGIFFNNPSEIFVDISSPTRGTRATRWVAETGVLELFVYAGPTMDKVLDQHTRLTGRPYLPPMYSLGFHQCRWNYRDQKDVEEVHAKFEEFDFPVDVIWLDIEHTDGKRYFTWDKSKFPDPIRMQDELKHTGRRMVTIVDPHVKRASGYFVHEEAQTNGYYLKDGAQDFEGWCWPGSSSYPDFTSPKVREWWGSFYSRYEGSTNRLGIWIDMNEMSVFNGPEVTMKKTALNLEGIEHREWHNLYGFHYHQTTFEGLKRARNNQQRPFILTRSFFAGTQRFGAIWTGDNTADWGHLKITAPMLLAMSVSGLHFVGADVGGFFRNPDAELMVRWFESGAFQPFFRAHAHIETKRREPWLFGEEALRQMRDVTMERYRHLAYIYTVFEEASRTGLPVMRPVFGSFSNQPIEQAWLLGSDLLVLPVVAQGQNKLHIEDVPSHGEFVDFATGRKVLRGASFDAPLGKTPVFQRVGSILPKQMRLRRSSELMIRDPFSLYVVVDGQGKATGSLYLDDQISFAHANGQFARVEFNLTGCEDGSQQQCRLEARVSGSGYVPENRIERVVFIQGSKAKLGCTSGRGFAEQDGSKSEFAVECDASSVNMVVWRKPWVGLASGFVLSV